MYYVYTSLLKKWVRASFGAIQISDFIICAKMNNPHLAMLLYKKNRLGWVFLWLNQPR